MRPRLKSVAWERLDADQLRVVRDVREQLIIDDSDGTVERLLDLLRQGGHTVAELAETLAVPTDDVADAIALFDEHRLLEDGDRLGRLTPVEQERYFSNLAFFESFATLQASREDLQDRLRDAHVLVLGTGGLNSNTLPHLCGLGVGRITLLDRDTVDVRNFARQYLYQWSDLGARKVERAAAWVRAFDPTIDVAAVDGAVDGPETVQALIDRTSPNVVMSGVDSPVEVDSWVNSACVAAGVPYVRGGMWVTQGIVWSVDPGRSACRQCPRDDPETPDPAAMVERESIKLYTTLPRANRGIGPVAGLLGALAAFEVLRYLTGFEPPAYAGRPLTIDFAAECATRQDTWVRDPSCSACGEVARQPAAPALATEGR